MKTSTDARNEDGGDPRAAVFGAGQATVNLLLKMTKEYTPLPSSEELNMLPTGKLPFDVWHTEDINDY